MRRRSAAGVSATHGTPDAHRRPGVHHGQDVDSDGDLGWGGGVFRYRRNTRSRRHLRGPITMEPSYLQASIRSGPSPSAWPRRSIRRVAAIVVLLGYPVAFLHPAASVSKRAGTSLWTERPLAAAVQLYEREGFVRIEERPDWQWGARRCGRGQIRVLGFGRDQSLAPARRAALAALVEFCARNIAEKAL